VPHLLLMLSVSAEAARMPACTARAWSRSSPRSTVSTSSKLSPGALMKCVNLRAMDRCTLCFCVLTKLCTMTLRAGRHDHRCQSGLVLAERALQRPCTACALPGTHHRIAAWSLPSTSGSRVGMHCEQQV